MEFEKEDYLNDWGDNFYSFNYDIFFLCSSYDYGGIRMNTNNANRKRGKRTEKNMEKLVGGKRIGLLGKEDIEHPIFSFEIKDRYSFIGKTFMEQAVRNAPEGKIPVVVVHVTRDQHKDDLVMIRLKDWRDLHG